MGRKRTAAGIIEKKARGERIAALTAYDISSARLVDEADMDIVLVGDSLGMVVQGEENTLRVTLEDVIYHCRCVARAVRSALRVADMPFGSFHGSPAETAGNAVRLVKEGRAEAVKIEGGRVRINAIRAVLDSEIPVMGHLGLTPQSVHRFGGYRVQGKRNDQIDGLIEDARALEHAGCFALVLECIPWEVADRITRAVGIPTIGIGAGPACDGQILVFHDMLGLNPEMDYRFVRTYAKLGEIAGAALRQYVEDVRAGAFPSLEESFSLDPSVKEDMERRHGSDHQDQPV